MLLHPFPGVWKIASTKKLKKFAHHYEFESSGLKLNDLEKMIKEKKVVYDHSVDQRGYKWGGLTTLKKIPLSDMPNYLRLNYEKYSNWIDV